MISLVDLNLNVVSSLLGDETAKIRRWIVTRDLPSTPLRGPSGHHLQLHKLHASKVEAMVGRTLAGDGVWDLA